MILVAPNEMCEHRCGMKTELTNIDVFEKSRKGRKDDQGDQ